jgi:Flp pilus assembly protein TadG
MLIFDPRRRERGQVLVMMVLALIVVIGGMGLIIDGGNAWSQQRITQAANDAAAEAGTIVLAKYNAGAVTPVSGWDAAVLDSINSSATTNGVVVPVDPGTGRRTAYYTDICGTLLLPDGTKATSTSDAAVVGAGTLPVNNHTNPDCPSGIVGPVAGVQVGAARTFGTFVSRIMGFTTFTANTTATAVTGLLQDCTVESGCMVLPVTAPVTVVTCDGTGSAAMTVPPTPWPPNTRVVVPLCKNNPGNVGWIDWTPKGGGTSELVNSILHPNNPAITLPAWEYVTSTGDPNSKSVDDALNTYDGKVVMFPMFDLTCASDPVLNQVKVAPNYGCSNIGGTGSNQWYRFPEFGAFLLEHAYVNGNNKAQCDTGNGATSCLIGMFVDFVATGTVGPGVGGGSTTGGVTGVQLIK